MNRLSSKLFVLFFLAATMVHAQDLAPQVLNADQVAKLDLNGKWSGKRNQYSWDKKTFVESFQYEFDLQQAGNIVTGTSTIIDANGFFADMKLEGVIIGNKLHFREYQVQNAIRPDGRVWCFKSGELNFVKNGDNLTLAGATPSYMEVYNYPCSGGETNLNKLDNSTNLQVLSTAAATDDSKPMDNLTINTFPNPFVESANISYTLNDVSRVRLEVFDISGKLMTTLYDGNENAGAYTFNFDAKNFSSLSGIYVIKMTLNGNVYSRQMVQMR